MSGSLYLNTKFRSTTTGPNQNIHASRTPQRIEKEYHDLMHLLESMNEHWIQTKEKQEQLTHKVDQISDHLVSLLRTLEEQPTSKTVHYEEENRHTLITLTKQMEQLMQVNRRLQEEISSYSVTKGPFVKIFQSLPANYPVQCLFVSGTCIEVTHFLNIDPETDIAHFTDETELKAIDCNKIDGVSWKMEDVSILNQ